MKTNFPFSEDAWLSVYRHGTPDHTDRDTAISEDAWLAMYYQDGPINQIDVEMASSDDAWLHAYSISMQRQRFPTSATKEERPLSFGSRAFQERQDDRESLALSEFEERSTESSWMRVNATRQRPRPPSGETSGSMAQRKGSSRAGIGSHGGEGPKLTPIQLLKHVVTQVGLVSDQACSMRTRFQDTDELWRFTDEVGALDRIIGRIGTPKGHLKRYLGLVSKNNPPLFEETESAMEGLDAKSKENDNSTQTPKEERPSRVVVDEPVVKRSDALKPLESEALQKLEKRLAKHQIQHVAGPERIRAIPRE